MRSTGKEKETPGKALPLVHIYSDGSCKPNPGAGGWAAILISPASGRRRELSGAVEDSTNNRMELTAAIMGLRALNRPCRVIAHTDSRYLRDAFEAGWLDRWQRNGWRTADKKRVVNQDLWEELLELAKAHAITWVWIKAHADDVENNRCDELANLARERLQMSRKH